MTAPSFVQVGAKGSGTGAVTYALPTGVLTGDLLVLAIETANQAITAPSGWTIQAQPGSGTAGGTAATRLTVLTQVYNSTTYTAQSFADPGDHQVGGMIALRGVNNTTIIDVSTTTTEATADTTITFPSVTTTGLQSFVLLIEAHALPDSATDGQTSGQAMASLTSPVELMDYNTNAGNGGGVSIFGGVKTTAGSTGTGSGTASAATVTATVTIAFRRAAADPLIANTRSYTLTRNDANLIHSARLTADTASVALTRFDAGLTYTPGANNYTITADTVNFDLIERDANLLQAHRLAADTGSFIADYRPVLLRGQDDVYFVGEQRTTTESTTSLSCTLPSHQEGDFLLLEVFWAAADRTIVTEPSGWTLIGSGDFQNQTSNTTVESRLYWKLAGSPEINPSFSVTSSTRLAGIISAFRKVSSKKAFEVAPILNLGSFSTTNTISNITSNTARTLWLGLLHHDDISGHPMYITSAVKRMIALSTTDTGYTAPDGRVLYAGDNSGIGATGTQTFSLNSTTGQIISSASILLRRASADKTLTAETANFDLIERDATLKKTWRIFADNGGFGLDTVTRSNQFSDDFNRANSTNLGSNWQIQEGGFQIVNNTVKGQTFASSVATVTSGTYGSNQFAQITISDLNNSPFDFIGIGVRISGLQGYYFVADGDSSRRIERRNAGGVSESINSKNIRWKDGDVVTLTAENNVISLYRNGELVDRVKDSSYTTGVPAIRYKYENNLTAAGDNFVSGNLVDNTNLRGSRRLVAETGLYSQVTETFSGADLSQPATLTQMDIAFAVSDGAGNLRCSDGARAVAYTQGVTTSEHYSEFTITALPSAGQVIAVGARIQTSGTGFYYFGAAPGSSSNYIISEYDAGVIATSTIVPRVGDRIRIEARGSTLYGYVNGILACQATDTTYLTGRPGVVLFGLGTARADNLQTGPTITYELAEQDATLKAARKLTSDFSTYDLIERDATLRAARKLVAEQQTYTVVEQTATLTKIIVLTAQTQTFTYSGSEIFFGRYLSLARATFTITGPPTGLTAIADSHNVIINPPAGWALHLVTDVSQAGNSACIYYGLSPAVAVGDQILHRTTTETNGRTVTVSSTGIVSSTPSGIDTVKFRHWTPSTWSAELTFSLTAGNAYTLTAEVVNYSLALVDASILKKVTLLARGEYQRQVFADDFERPDESLDANSNWLRADVEIGSLSIVSGKVFGVDVGNVYNQTLSNDQWVEISFEGPFSTGTDKGVAVLLRSTGGLSTFSGYSISLMRDNTAPGDILSIRRHLLDTSFSNVYTSGLLLATTRVPELSSPPTVIKLKAEIIGNTIYAYVNDYLWLTAINSDHTSGKVGIWSDSSSILQFRCGGIGPTQLTSIDTNLIHAARLTADVRSYTLTRNDANLRVGRRLTAESYASVQLWSDSFTGAAAVLGSNYTQQGDALLRLDGLGNVYSTTSSARAIAWPNTVTFSNNQYAEITLTQVSTINNGNSGIILRVQTTEPAGTEKGYKFKTGDNGQAYTLKEYNESSIDTFLANTTIIPKVGDRLKAVAISNTLYFYVNNQLIASVSDNSWSTGVPGIYGFSDGWKSDDFVAGNHGGVTFAGTYTNTLANRKLVAETSSYTLTLRDANLLQDHRLTADTQSYTLIGNSTSLITTRYIGAGGVDLQVKPHKYLAANFSDSFNYGSFQILGDRAEWDFWDTDNTNLIQSTGSGTAVQNVANRQSVGVISTTPFAADQWAEHHHQSNGSGRIQAGPLVRASSGLTTNGYSFVPTTGNPFPTQFVIIKYVNGVGTILATSAPNVFDDIKVSTMYRFRLEAIGNKLYGYINEKLIVTATDNTFLTGQPGFQIIYGGSTYDFFAGEIDSNSVNLIHAARLTADTQSYTLTLNDGDFFTAGSLIAGHVHFNITANDANLIHAARLTADTRSYTLTRNDANLLQGHRLTADTRSYTLTGSDANLLQKQILLAQHFRGNLIPNSQATGAVVGVIGSGGSLPTGWTIIAVTGITREIVATGIMPDGNPYIDIRWSGTNNSGTISYPDLYFIGNNARAYVGDKFTASVYIKTIAGSRTGFVNAISRISLSETNSLGNYIQDSSSSTIEDSRGNISRTFTSGSVFFAKAFISMAIPAGNSVDVTLRFSAPQLEPGLTATAYIPTTGTQVFRDYSVEGIAANLLQGHRLTADTRSYALTRNDANLLQGYRLTAEEFRSNLLRYSEQFDNAAWVPSAATVSQNFTTAPTGALTADKISDASNFPTGKAFVTQTVSVTPSTTHTITIYAKAAEYQYIEFQVVDSTTPANFNRYPIINLSNGAVTSSGAATLGTNLFVTNIGNGWYRLTLLAELGALTSSINIRPSGRPTGINELYAGSIGSGIYLWGAQLEKSSFATAYIPTVATAEYRWFETSLKDANLLQGHRLTADTRSYTLTRNDANLLQGHRLTAESRSYTFIGNDANLRTIGKLIADTRSYTLTGNSVNLLRGAKLVTEGFRGNYIPNSSMQGAGVDTLPTGWYFNNYTGITISILGTGTDSNGNNYLDIRYSGTNNTGALVYPGITLIPQPAEGPITKVGEFWTASAYLQQISGTAVPLVLSIRENTYSGGFLGQQGVEFTPNSTNTRYSLSRSLTKPSVEKTGYQIFTTIAIGASIDTTFRLSAPQLEKGANLTPYISTTNAIQYRWFETSLKDANLLQGHRLTADTRSYALTRNDANLLVARRIAAEEFRANYIRNSMMIETIPGTPGTAPTFWQTATPAWCTRTIVGTGIDINTGLIYIDISFNGTNNTGSTSTIFLDPMLPTGTQAQAGQTWTSSAYFGLVSGSWPASISYLATVGRDSTGTLLESSATSIKTVLSSNLEKITRTFTTTNFSVKNIQTAIRFDMLAGDSINLTVRIAAPQLERGSVAREFIPTTNAVQYRWFETSLKDANLLQGHRLTADTRSYTLTGNAAEFLNVGTLSAETATYNLVGNSVNLRVQRRIVAQTRSYSLTGTNVNLLEFEVLRADSRSYTFTGNSANILISRRITAQVRSYDINDISANILFNRKLFASTATFTTSYSDINKKFGRNLIASTLYVDMNGYVEGGYVDPNYTSTSANLLASKKITISSQTYTLIGQEILFVRPVKLVRVWDGTSWTPKLIKVWSGTIWVEKPVRRWTGSSWQ